MVSSRLSSLLLLASIAQASTHGGIYANSHAHAERAARLSRRQDNRTFTLVDSSEGSTFFDNWTFVTIPDPTNGLVNYVDSNTAFSTGLAYVRDDGVAVMRVDNTTTLQEGQNRNSVRIETNASYGQGLFIMDVLQMPYGCSVWPAFWSNGANWPTGGEIDIIEGTQNITINQSTLHTLPGCTLDSSRQNSDGAQLVSDATFTGNVASTVCDATVDNNSGCGITNPDTNSYGFGLNSVGGGAYATLWNEEGIRVWFFARADIPDDITNQSPDPSSWPAPVAFWSTNSCPMNQFFTNQTFIYDITLCGDLGNATFGPDGCPGTCSQFVTDPANFRTAMWKINYFRVYN